MSWVTHENSPGQIPVQFKDRKLLECDKCGGMAFGLTIGLEGRRKHYHVTLDCIDCGWKWIL